MILDSPYISGSMSFGIANPSATMHISASTGAVLRVDGAGVTNTGSLFVSSSGNVGIGTVNPVSKLQVEGGALRIGDGAGGWSGFTFSGGLRQTNNNPLTILGELRVDSTAGNPSYISGSGGLGIGKTTANTRLDVNGNTLISGSINATGPITGSSFTTTGTITAQTIVVQTITSSTDFVTGSTRFGSLASNTHQFTGSVLISGSSTAFAVNNNTLFISSSGNVGIGTTTPLNKLNVLVDGGGAEDGIRLGVGSQGDGIKIVQRYLSDRVVATLGQANYSGASDSGALRLYDVNGAETVRLSGKSSVASFFASGSLGVGTISPNAAAYAGRVLTIGNGTTYENALELNSYNITDDTLSDVAFLNGASSDVDKRVCLVRANRSGANNSGALLFYTKNSGTFGERMRIGADGRVFIGIAGSSNGHKLEINAGTTSAIRVDVTSGTSGLSMSPGATLGIDKPGVGGGTLFINSTGQILVNTNATVLTSGWLCIAVESSNYNAVVLKDTGTTYSSGNYYQLFTNSNNGIAGGIVHNSASTVSYYTGPSDARLKSNIQDWTQEVLPLFADIKPKTYNHIEDNDESVVYKGYLAQDMIDKFPEAYGQNKDGYYTFNPNGYIPYLVKAIQELNTKLDAANAEIEALKAK